VLVPTGGTAQDRFEDYTPTRPANQRFGGKADGYGKFLVEELKPLIDTEYRTLKTLLTPVSAATPQAF
jgi:predicted alpha/beta superfamily hydrolase